MKSIVKSKSFTVEQTDVLYVAQQINRDLQELHKAYSRLISADRVMNLFNAYVEFLYNFAVSRLGFSIYDPANSNLVYHEYRYRVVYGLDVASINPNRGMAGRGGRSVGAIWIPSTAKFSPWVTWSSSMRNLSRTEQRQIVSGTGWSIPSEAPRFERTYSGGNWRSFGAYTSGNIGVSGREYRKS